MWRKKQQQQNNKPLISTKMEMPKSKWPGTGKHQAINYNNCHMVWLQYMLKSIFLNVIYLWQNQAYLAVMPYGIIEHGKPWFR